MSVGHASQIPLLRCPEVTDATQRIPTREIQKREAILASSRGQDALTPCSVASRSRIIPTQ